MRSKGGTVGLALLALLVGAPAASASTASLADGGNTVVYQGDAVGDSVTLARFVDSRGNPYYLLTDSGGITSGTGCFQASGTGGTTSACPVTAGLKRYRIATGDGDDRVDITGATNGGDADLGNGADRFTGLDSGSAADSVTGGEGNDTVNGGAGDDPIAGGGGDDTLNGGGGADVIDGGVGADLVSGGPGDDLVGGGEGDDRVAGDDGNDSVGGGPGNDQVAGEAGNDSVDGGPGNDSLEFGGTDVPAGVGAGADDLHGGDGVDLLSYIDHTTGITLTLDGQPGDGSAGEGDNVHDDVETVIGTTLADTMTGDDVGQDLYGNGGDDTITGLGGDDLLNGGTGEDVIFGGPGDDALEGSADGDLLDGGPGQDLFQGDNECLAEPCTGGSDDIQARDGEQDTVNCGVGADRATVDAVDIVAIDTQQGCESIDRAAPPAAAPPPGTTPPGGTLLPKMEIHGARGLRTLLTKGLFVYVTCPGACRIRARLILRKTVVAGARRTRITGGLTRLRVKALRVGKRQLKHRTKVLMTLVVDVTDSAGHKTTLARPITLKTAKPAKKKKG